MAGVNNVSTPIQRAAEALRTLQSLNDADIERVASLSTQQSHVNPAPETALSPLRSELAQRFPTLRNRSHRARSVGSMNINTSNTSKRRAHTRSVSSTLKRGRPVSKSLIYKDLVIIPHPETSRVPTHKNRVELERKGLVVSEFPFDKSWDAATLSEKMKEQLPLAYIPFQFVKACYGSLVLPKLAEGVDLTCEVLMKIAGQGCVYVRLLEEFKPEEEESSDGFLTNIFADEPEEDTNVVIPEFNDDPVYAYADHGTENHLSVSNSLESPVIVVDRNNGSSNAESEELLQFLASDDYQIETPPPLLVREIVIKRSNIVKSLISEFKDSDIPKYTLVFVFMGDNGILENGRGSGVTREILSLFWREFSIALSIGASEKVPSIRHDHQTSEWVSVARILTYGYKEEGYFPLFLSRAFIASCIFGDNSVTADCLLDSFKAYISKDEQDTMNKCLNGEFDPKDEDVLDLLSSYNCYRNPTKENIRITFEELAHQELIQKPRYISNAWSEELQSLKGFPEFSNFRSLSVMYAEKKPSSKRVIKLIEAEPKSDADRACLDHLKRFIKSLDDNMLAGFLQFLTGSDIITVRKISVSFNANEGHTRGIVAHTCGPLLELSSTYQSYNELSEELTNILRNSAAWSFVIV